MTKVLFVEGKFKLGRVLSTPGAQAAMQQTGEGESTFLARHLRGDWGELCEEDKQRNEEALTSGARLFSAYHLEDGTKIWCITEAVYADGNRRATTLLLPSEY